MVDNTIVGIRGKRPTSLSLDATGLLITLAQFKTVYTVN